METSEDQVVSSRRTLRTRTSNTGGSGPGSAPLTGTPQPRQAGADSPRSDDSKGSRSSRLNNPEFAAKHKAFMAKVTAATKGPMDSYLSAELVASTQTGKRKLSPRTGDEQQHVKRRRSTRTNSSGLDVQSDGYCWICHKEGDVLCCETCPRVFHLKCLQLDTSPAEDWVCPECVLVMTAENMETRSRAMRLLTIDQLCTLLKHALTRMKSVANIEPFLKPVDPLQFPAYKDYISCPMDIQSMERNIRRKQYGSTEAMLADCKWIMHNCIIFNSPSSKLTTIAKSIVKVCKHEMQEVENCPDCYLNAHIKKEVWFTEACRLPHPLVWAKLKGFPFWPGKVMRVNSENYGDIRFFGAHDRAWIPMKDVYLYSKKPPIDIKKKRGNLDSCFQEVDKHIKKLKDRFHQFNYANHKTLYDPNKEAEMLKILFPSLSLPFDIGKVGRRSRSYSLTGSERSRDATPTPSESGQEDNDMPDEVKTEEPLKIKIEIPKLRVSRKDIKRAEQSKEIAITVKELIAPPSVVKEVNVEDIQHPVTDNLEVEEPAAKEEVALRKPEQVQTCSSKVQEEEDIIREEDVNNTANQSPTVAENQITGTLIESAQSVAEETSDVAESDAGVLSVDKLPGEYNDVEPVEDPPINDTANSFLQIVEPDKRQETFPENFNAPEPETNKSAQNNDLTQLSSKDAEASDEEPVEGPTDEGTKEEKGTENNSISAVVEEYNATDKLEAESLDKSRQSTSPPCEVSSTTEGAKTVRSAKVTEGVIADSNDEKVIVEDDEIDDDEPMELDTEPQAQEPSAEVAGTGSATEVEEVEDKTINETTDSSEKKNLIDPKSLLAGGVSITVIDRKKNNDAEAPVEEEAEEDISVSISRKEKKIIAPEKQDESKKVKELSAVRRDRSSTNSEAEPNPEQILTISKIVSMKDSPRPPSASEGRRSQTSSPSIASHIGAHPPPYFAPRLPGFRGPHPIGHRGPLMPMVGPHRPGMMMHNQFRGPRPVNVPNLQARPAGPLNLPPSLPSVAGPVAQQLNKVAAKLAESLKKNFLETLSDIKEKNDPDSVVKALQMECEKQQWRHQQELAEMKHNADLVIMEMRATMEQDKQKAIVDFRKQADLDKQKAILDTKKKQWCAHCGKEAIFYCCWNTSYCDYPCQQAHWPTHMSTCAQNAGEEETNAGHLEAVQHHPHYLSQLPQPGPHHSRRPMHMRMPGGMAPVRYGMRHHLPGQMPFPRPYYM